MNYNQKIGQFGEELAKRYLLRKGYRIIAKNKNTGHKEIDIIAMDKKDLVFVEVKTRTSLIYGEADEAATARKINNIRRATELYLQYNNINYSDIRIDLISVDINKSKKIANIKHYKDIV
ncbi:YraN family protein [Candidatus Falkowbacteria bacterium CG_4_9_14_3_um_filter_36_9]|uniref:UPF0102 protein AUJ27_03305 n=2 Tax=Candidatus Falkowiibacteriota TaxID=1752728 RepID=A0A1J4T7R5_9BACT|nr:MAG: YraN family protein [Candidatus Falkowbacteria bacterium CG1_02_37_44]PIV51932.1 MAG: YraN family protein [Candidatus Falkowbacteria bacterium CG02_land_8_20_14_3_00_36_14]PIX12099.1 MAG: YraN family protein [Candidatus Falkowbacteria bacterium CG_4_8_14_3_um_filter_36_11]PJA10726.1 MAG: YraN family protein [Candidatus Falkowbacteria bacterium CG_4_10_14_0_2_um_filter_36_22]PJB19901.1 MAG: YraN family protein [Candidatus Falkowbacteria bacterium CG_4_9_14_3_um_filter_36_9]